MLARLQALAWTAIGFGLIGLTVYVNLWFICLYLVAGMTLGLLIFGMQMAFPLGCIAYSIIWLPLLIEHFGTVWGQRRLYATLHNEPSCRQYSTLDD